MNPKGSTKLTNRAVELPTRKVTGLRTKQNDPFISLH